jgi:hypothetical protein
MIEDNFDEQYNAAAERGTARLAQLPKATSARFDLKSGRIVLEMQNGVTLFVPVDLIQGLQFSDEIAMSDFDLVAEGTQLHWHTLDVQFYVEDLLKGVFGTSKWMNSLDRHLADIGRKGGSSRSGSKAAASRANGKKGGRPAKKVA